MEKQARWSIGCTFFICATLVYNSGFLCADAEAHGPYGRRGPLGPRDSFGQRGQFGPRDSFGQRDLFRPRDEFRPPRTDFGGYNQPPFREPPTQPYARPDPVFPDTYRRAPEPDPPPPPPSEAPLPAFVIPCAPNIPPCNVIEDASLTLELLRSATGIDAAAKIRSWVNHSIGGKIVIVSLPKLLISEREAMKELIKFEVKAIDVITQKLQSDLARLRPFRWWDTESRRKAKREAIRRDEQQVNSWKEEAISESRSRETWMPARQPATSSSSTEPKSERPAESKSSFKHSPSEAMRQAIKVDLKGWGSN